MFTFEFSYAQNSLKKDTIYTIDKSFEEKAIYGAKDSIYIDLKENKIHLFGEAHLEYLETNMKAGYIIVDLKKMKFLQLIFTIKIVIE
jgi:lipopolysaccharide export system protein LptA